MTKIFKAQYRSRCRICHQLIEVDQHIRRIDSGYAHHICAGGTYTNLDDPEDGDGPLGPKAKAGVTESVGRSRRPRGPRVDPLVEDEDLSTHGLDLARDQYRKYANLWVPPRIIEMVHPY
jgi:hypothetical protein